MDKPKTVEVETKETTQPIVSKETPATTSATSTKPPKKSKKVLIILLVLALCCCLTFVGALVAAYLNSNSIMKSLATVKLDDSYTRYTAAKVSIFTLEDALSADKPTVDVNGDMVVSLAGESSALYALTKVPAALQGNIGIKFEAGKALLQFKMEDLQPSILSKDSFKDVYVNAVVVVGTNLKTFKVSSLTTGNGIVDMLLPSDTSSKLETQINNNLGDLGDGLTNIAITASGIDLTYSVTKYDVSNGVTHATGTVTTFDTSVLR